MTSGMKTEAMTTEERAALCREVCEFLGWDLKATVQEYVFTGNGLAKILRRFDHYSLEFFEGRHRAYVACGSKWGRCEDGASSPEEAVALAVRDLARRSKR